MDKKNMPFPASQVNVLEGRLAELAGQKTSMHVDRLLKSALVHVRDLAVQPNYNSIVKLKGSLEELQATGLDVEELLMLSITKPDGWCTRCGSFSCTNPSHKT